MLRGCYVLVALIMVGCDGSSPTQAAPGPPLALDRAPVSISAASSIQQLARPGRAAPVNPTVLVRDRFAMPVSGVTVNFLAESEGSVAATSARTDGSGLASSGAWMLPAAERVNRLVATLNGVGSVTFTAAARAAALPVERYDLLTIGGAPLPITYSGGGRSWTIIEGHYEFASNDTFDFWSVWTYADNPAKRDSVIVTGSYSRLNASAFVIYFPVSPVGDGMLAGDRLSIVYSDFLSWEPEVYVRSR